MSHSITPAPDRFRDSFAALGGFMTALQLARLIGLEAWGGGLFTSANTIFFLGAASGRQTWVHLFHLLFIPAFTAGWARACLGISRPYMFWGLNAAVSWPLWLFLGHAPQWTVAAILVSLALRASRKHPVWAVLAESPSSFFRRWPAILVCIAFYYLWLFPGWRPPFSLDLYHEGVQLGPAADFLAGKAPFRDIFIPHGLIHNVLKTAAAFRLFGESIAAKKLLDALTGPLGFVAMALLGRLALKNSYLWLLFIVALPLSSNYFPDRQFFACLSLAALAAGESSGQDRMAFLAGGLAGWQVWESLEVGLYSLATGLIFLFLRARSRGAALRSYAAGLIGLSIPFIAYLLGKGALGEFIRQSYLQCARQQASEGLRYHALKLFARPAGPPDPIWLWYLPLLVQYGAACLLVLRWKRWPRKDLSLGVLLTLAAIFFFYSALNRGDFEHLSFCAPYSFLLGMWLIERSLPCAASTTANSILVLSPILAVGGALASMLAWAPKLRLKSGAMSANIATLSQAKVSDYGRLDGVHLAAEVESIVEKIKELYPPEAPMFPMMGDSGLLFLSNHRNLSRYYLPDYITDESIEREVLGELRAAAGPIIVTYRDPKRPADHRGHAFKLLRNYLDRRCRPAWSSANYTLWKKA